MAHTRIAFLILPQLHLIDLAGPLQVFHEAIEMGADLSIDYCSTGEELITPSQFPIGKLKHFTELKLVAGDYLFVPGSLTSYLVSKKLAAQKELFAWVRTQHANGVNVCSVCTGAFFLAQAGLLNGRKCTTHWQKTAELKQRFPAINLVEDVLFTDDDGIYTSAGVTSGIDLALFLVSKLTNENISYNVARELVVYVRRRGSESQQSIYMKHRNHIHSGIHKAQDYLQENLKQKVSLSQLADSACMSVRNLTRTFKKETGITVNEYTSLLRKELLKRLSANPGVNRKQMAMQCGLKSERQVIRLLKTV